jgi:hypothetical protein
MKMMTTGELLRKAAEIAAECGHGGGGWHIQDAYEQESYHANAAPAMALYHYLFDPSTPGNDVYIWFDTINEVVLALLFAAEAADSGDFPDMKELEQPQEAPSLVTKQAIMKAMPGTARQLMEATGFVIGTVNKWVREMHKEQSCHISGWEPPTNGRTGPAAAIYSAGMGVDAVYDYVSTRKIVSMWKGNTEQVKLEPTHDATNDIMAALYGN